MARSGGSSSPTPARSIPTCLHTGISTLRRKARGGSCGTATTEEAEAVSRRPGRRTPRFSVPRNSLQLPWTKPWLWREWQRLRSALPTSSPLPLHRLVPEGGVLSPKVEGHQLRRLLLSRSKRPAASRTIQMTPSILTTVRSRLQGRRNRQTQGLLYRGAPQLPAMDRDLSTSSRRKVMVKGSVVQQTTGVRIRGHRVTATRVRAREASLLTCRW